ncbi:MAG: FHA domain-containing protein [Prevotellaceae bacterium]|jgi:hypothetical protein|nr:FHA domain-containing protein [Prevotellaceae bacterium]
MKVVTIGRSQDNDIVVNDVKASRNHLQIVQDDNGNCSAVDLGSTNGTLVNGQRLTGTVRLQPNDVVQIGDTKLPWQEYFMAKQQLPIQQFAPTPELVPKHKRTVWYMAATVSVLLLVGGGITLKVYHDKKQEKIEAENKVKVEEAAKLQQETDEKEAKAKRLQDEADELFRKALISQSDKDNKLAAEKQKEADTAKDDATKARAAQQKAEKERDEALKAKDGALKAKEKAEADKADAENRAKQVQEDASKKQKELSQERDKAHATTRQLLQESFNENFPKLGRNKNLEVAKKLSYTSKTDAEAKTKIQQEFDKAENAKNIESMQKIINAIKEVLGKQIVDEKAKEAVEKAKQDSIQKTKTAPAQKPQTDSTKQTNNQNQ